MEKDIGKIPKNDTSDIVIRVDDFGGKRGLTIREFVTSDRYTGFTKAGVRIPAAEFLKFREMINSVSVSEMAETPEPAEAKTTKAKPKAEQETLDKKEEMPDY
ncbi:MAG: hypothetical protein KKB31_06305 [Nanoarchaeota archaeon]|nr:hypothetical protein [Nanoarchaeota archaeon]